MWVITSLNRRVNKVVYVFLPIGCKITLFSPYGKKKSYFFNFKFENCHKMI